MSTKHRSKVIAYAVEFQRAVKAAIAIAGKEPNDIIQFRFDLSDQWMSVCARNEDDKIFLAADVGISYLDLDYERDAVVEVSVASARVFSAMAMKPSDSEDDPLVGLFISDDTIVRTDESGLGLNLRRAQVHRANHPAQGSALGDVAGVVDRWDERTSIENGGVLLSPRQIKRVGAVAAAMEEPLTVTGVVEDQDNKVGWVAADGKMVRLRAVAAKTPAGEMPTENTPGRQHDSFEDDYVAAVKSSGSHVVQARPLRSV